MQDGSRNKSLPTSKLLREPSAGRALEGNGGMFSEASSDGELCMDSGTELNCGDGDFADLNAFLSADEINRSLDLALEAFSNVCEPEDPGPSCLPEQEQALQSASSLPLSQQILENVSLSPNLQHQTKAICPEDYTPVPLSSSQSACFSKPELLSGQAQSSVEKPVCHKPTKPVYKQDKPRLVHGGLELSDRAASASEFCSRAATFIEELSSIFKGSAHLEQQVEEESSSPDSGYLSPRNQQGSACVPSLPPGQRDEAQSSQSEVSPHSGGPAVDAASDGDQHSAASATFGPLSPPQFFQKLKSQEVAEGSPIHLECRVGGNPLPLVRPGSRNIKADALSQVLLFRGSGHLHHQHHPIHLHNWGAHLGHQDQSYSGTRWFCEGRELQNSPDIQISTEGDLQTLVIAEAFEDDTGRYTCVASNSLGAENTSAEVYIEGASSSDSEAEGAGSKSRSGAMPQVQKKTSSMSLTIRSSSPKAPEVPPHRSYLVQSMSQPPQRTQSPVSLLQGSDVSGSPVFTKHLQDAQASEGQVVVLECRVRGSPPPQVRWYREGNEILDSPDFRILQKKPRSAAEPEEICTLVIAEAFPEDGGLFCCTASNPCGSVGSSARLTVTSAEDLSTNSMSGDSSGFEDTVSFPPPPLPTEIPHLEPPKTLPPSGSEAFHSEELEIWPSMSAASPVQIAPDAQEKQEDSQQNGHHPSPPPIKKTTPPPPPLPHTNPDDPAKPQSPAHMTPSSPPTPGKLSPSSGRDGPPLPTRPKPKLNADQLKQLQEQVLLEQQEAANWGREQQNQEVLPPPPQPPLQEIPPPASSSPPLPPPPSFQELESSTAMQASTFNYTRPKQFIAAQGPGGGGFLNSFSGSSGSSLSSPLSPPASHKPFNRVSLPPFTKAGSVESPSSPSFPPPPPPFFTSSNLSSPSGLTQDFPPPPPPPPPPPASMSPAHSDVSSPFSSIPPSPASSFLSSVLSSVPTTPSSPPVNALGLPKGNGTVKVIPKKPSISKTQRMASDSDIQGSKDAVIQDLERKLRFKEERTSNGQQEYKVSSFEQRLISEIEFRLERSPVEESDEDVQYDEDAAGQGVAPSFEQKLKHYKVFEGMPVTFSCRVKGEPKAKIYWFKDGKQISKRSEHYRINRHPDGTCSLHTAAASLDDDGNYTILAANPQGRVSCTGRMMVQAVNQRGRSQRSTPGQMRRSRSRSRDSGDENDNIQERHFRPHFLQAPGDLIVQEGRLCRMDCKVSGLPTPDLVWQLNGHSIRPDSSHKMLVRENGVHSLVIEPVTSRDAGIYTCIASNRAGQNSFNLELIVAGECLWQQRSLQPRGLKPSVPTAREMHKAPSFVEKLQNTSVAEGHPVRLECRVTGVPYPQIFWKRENESFTHNTDRISMHQDNCGYLCMIIQPASKEDAGWYTVSAKNDAGIVSSTARLDVHTQWQQPNLPKPKKVRPSTSRYAALTERGLDVKAAFFPDSSPLPPGALVESEDL
ncbi:palladin isoform X4 [Oryzias latipes]|uniref:palladin isoform X4 n=1 Tax=Oryzias latipes TaxID=8090 RepID=UPI000CE228D4|nr:palladin isoform X4 [Oryzias latipes]